MPTSAGRRRQCTRWRLRRRRLDQGPGHRRTSPARPATAAAVRVVHFSADAPAVDVATAGTDPADAVVKSLEYPNATGYLRFRPGSYDLEVRLAGTTTVALDTAGRRGRGVQQLQRLRDRLGGDPGRRGQAAPGRRRGRCDRVADVARHAPRRRRRTRWVPPAEPRPRGPAWAGRRPRSSPAPSSSSSASAAGSRPAAAAGTRGSRGYPDPGLSGRVRDGSSTDDDPTTHRRHARDRSSSRASRGSGTRSGAGCSTGCRCPPTRFADGRS